MYSTGSTCPQSDSAMSCWPTSSFIILLQRNSRGSCPVLRTWPTRSSRSNCTVPWPLTCSHFVWPIGCNRVTQNDAPCQRPRRFRGRRVVTLLARGRTLGPGGTARRVVQPSLRSSAKHGSAERMDHGPLRWRCAKWRVTSPPPVTRHAPPVTRHPGGVSGPCMSPPKPITIVGGGCGCHARHRAPPSGHPGHRH